uniref:Uncharacterized protein n=1 Tax=Helianthus annuus TaxID=4232 RepID=A0A251SYK7_HELAN
MEFFVPSIKPQNPTGNVDVRRPANSTDPSFFSTLSTGEPIFHLHPVDRRTPLSSPLR